MRQQRATDDLLARARSHYSFCQLCEHRCGANRLSGERGPCKAGPVANIFRHRVEYSEESELVPSHLFYLSGCDLRCAFCIAEASAFDPRRGRPLTRDFFRQAVTWGKEQGARTLQWVGGEPTIHLPAILEVMKGCPNLPDIVWKSDFHGTPDAFDLLNGVVDYYVADLKFGNDACAQRVAGVQNYMGIVCRNLLLAGEQARLIIRHLLLPGHFECCYQPIVAWIKINMPRVKFSLRDGYLPRWQAQRYKELAQPLSKQEAGRAFVEAERVGLKLVY